MERTPVQILYQLAKQKAFTNYFSRDLNKV